jgi:hypothetical protein
MFGCCNRRLRKGNVGQLGVLRIYRRTIRRGPDVRASCVGVNEGKRKFNWGSRKKVVCPHWICVLRLRTVKGYCL